MFIESLHLKNWLSYSDTMLELAQLTSVRGENGSGKTSIEQVLEMLYTGRAEDGDGNSPIKFKKGNYPFDSLEGGK